MTGQNTGQIKCTYTARDGFLSPISASAAARATKWLEEHEGSTVEVVFTAMDSVEHFQHKYLYGYCYEPMAQASGMEVDEIDHEMKLRYLRRAVSSIGEIPHRYRGRCIVLMDGESVVGYVPSKSALTYQEYADYIQNVERERDGLEGWHIPDWETARDVRRAAIEYR